MSFPRYPAYKDSGVEWLGEVPEHWSVQRFKLSVESCMNGAWGEEPGNGENDVTCMRVADFDRLKLVAAEPDEPTIRSVSARDIEQRSLCNGDLLIEKSGGGEKQPVGAVVLYTGSTPSVCSNFVARMRLAQGMNPSFWRYAHHAAYSLKVTTKSIKQTSGIQNLDQQQYLDERAPFPPGEEQSAIATFLDRETAKIDALIAEQQRLIELLQEKRQAVISHAVTKGLNPDAPMKDSGVEWLGEVPEHWEVRPIKHLCDIYSGFPFKSDLFQGDGIPVVRMSNISGGCIDLQDAVCVPEHEVPAEAFIGTGDLLLGLSGSVGNFGIATEKDLPAAVNQRVALIRTSNPILKHFFGSSLFSDQVTCGLPSTTIANVSASQLGNCLLAVPPSDEQEKIEAFLLDFVSGSTELMSSIEASLSLLQERRSALISAAVTGQIDVRGLVAEASPA